MPQIDISGSDSKLSCDTIASQSGTTVTVQSGHNLVGSGSGLTALNATNVTSGTLPMARLSGTLPALNGSALTNLPSHTGNVAFPATQVASSDANTLDDFEEGSWTPTIQDATRSDSESQAYTTQQGSYTKIGSVVTVIGVVKTSSLGTLSGNLGMAGLPFAPKTGTTGGGLLPWSTGLALPSAGNTPLTCSLDSGSVHCTLWQHEVTAGIGGVSTTEWSADGHSYITFAYLTD